MKKLFLVLFLCTAFLFMGNYSIGDPKSRGCSQELREIQV